MFRVLEHRARPLLILIAASGALASASLAVDFDIREAEPETTSRTLDLVRTADVPPAKIWVYFTDKNVFDTATANDRLDEARRALSPRAARRRAKVLPDLVDQYDVPVHRAYVERVTALGATVLRESRWLNAVSVEASIHVLERIAKEPFVAKLTPVAGGARISPRVERVAPAGGESVPHARGELDYGASQAQLEEINVIAAHDLGLSGAGVRIATLDTGFWHAHTTFSTLVADGRLIDQYDFVNDDGETINEPGDPSSANDHGTLTWSAMAGFTNGNLIGPAYGAEYLLAKTEDVASETPVEEDNWCAAAEWADTNGADIITTSLGYLDWYTYEDLDGLTAAITLCADLAVSRGIVVVTSAGNQGSQPWFYITAPADAFHIISVGAVDESNVVAGFSSHGPTFDQRTKPEVVARGVSTYCAVPFNGYGTFNGTSLSAPLVAGACALLLEEHPEWTPDQVRAALLETADTTESPDNDRGWGRIDVVAALNAAVPAEAPGAGPAAPPPARPVLLAAPNPLGTRTVLSLALGGRAAGEVEIFDVAGRRVDAFAVTGPTAEIVWDARDGAGRLLAPGLYLARLTTPAGHAQVKLVVDR